MTRGNLTRKQWRAAIQIQGLAHSMFRALNLEPGYDTLTIQMGDGSPGSWTVTIDNTNDSGDRVVCESGWDLDEALSKAVGQVAQAHLVASRGDR